jgi:predicted O-linked N-acetylglucosamine transferase (SPINDLY family)
MVTISEKLRQAVQCHQAGDLVRAEQLYGQVLQANPDEPNALHLLGMLAQQCGQLQRAVDLIHQATVRAPQVAEFHSNLACALLSLGRWEEAAASSRQAVGLRPDLPQAHANLGEALAGQQQWQEAAACYGRALALDPQLTEVPPKLALALHALGLRLTEQGRLAEAVTALRDAARLRPDFAEAHYNLGVLFATLGRRDESLDAYEHAVRNVPEHVPALNNLANLYKDQGRIEEALALYRRAIALRPDLLSMQSNLLLTLHYDEGYDPEAVFAEHCRWGEQFAPSPSPETNDCDPRRRLRIGYVSAGFKDHILGRYNEAVLRAHDRGQVEVFCYANVLHPDVQTQRIRAAADHWRSIAELSDEQAAALIRQDRIDLLIDIGGHSASNRLGVFALKPAPLQVTHIGYQDTTGLPAMDYRLTDVFCDPPGWTEDLHTEKLVRLAGLQWCYVPPPDVEVSPLPAHQTGHVTFGSFSNLAKVTERMIAVWSQILTRLSGSKIILVAGAGQAGDQRVWTAFERHGVDRRCVELVGRQPLDTFLRLHHRVDLCLDTYPYTGYQSTADALWMGVPVVTLAGKTAITRQGVGLLQRVGLRELAADTSEAYVQAAVRLARDLPRLELVREQLRDRVTRSLTDVTAFTRNLEAAYRGIWEQFCQQVRGPVPR